MPGLVARVRAWLHTHEGRKLFRYTMVSVISTGVSLAVLAVLYGALRVWSEVPDTVVANVVAAFPSYWLNRAWAWGKTGRSHLLREVVPFWLMAAASIAFSVVGASVARWIGTHYNLAHLDRTILVLAANVASFGIFWVLKLMVFNRTFKVPTLLKEIDEHLSDEEQADFHDGERATV